MTKPIFKYSWKDSYLIMYTILLGILPFFFIWQDVSFWILAIFLPVHAWLITNVQNSALHHHSHWPTFSNKKINVVYEILISIVGGIAHQIWKYSHLKHHIYVNDKPVNGLTKDPVSVFQYGENGEVQNFWKFCWKMTKASYKNMSIFSVYNAYPRQVSKSKLLAEQLSFNLYFLSVFLCDYKYGIYIFLMYLLAFFLNGATSYGEHWGVLDRRGDTTQDSIGIYSRWYNIIGFGAGYHQEHHNKPNIHWTQLHTLTPRMHPNRVIKGGMHITNNPYWSHFKLLFKK